MNIFFELYDFSLSPEFYWISAMLGATLLLVRLYFDHDLEEKEYSIFAKLNLALAAFLLVFGLVGVALDTEAYALRWKSRFWSSLVLGLASAYIFLKGANVKDV